MKINIITSLALLMLSCPLVKAQNKPDDILGVWLTAGKDPAKIRIYKSGDTYCGKIAWLKDPDYNGKPKVDGHNPDPSKRQDPTLGLALLTGFKFEGKNEWTGGEIYDPESGKTYRCILTLTGLNTLKVRGYVGISLFGRTEIWVRN